MALLDPLATPMTQHAKNNGNMGLIQANTAAYMINYQRMCTNAHLQ